MVKSSAAECSLCERIGLLPLTKDNIFFHYIPLQGMISYAALSVNVMNPKFISGLIPKRDATNAILLHTVVGVAFYIYGRPHLKNVDTKKKIAYSAVGASIFSLGSVLGWAIIRSSLPENNALATVVGLGTGFAVARVSYDYLKHVDAVVKV